MFREISLDAVGWLGSDRPSPALSNPPTRNKSPKGYRTDEKMGENSHHGLTLGLSREALTSLHC